MIRYVAKPCNKVSVIQKTASTIYVPVTVIVNLSRMKIATLVGEVRAEMKDTNERTNWLSLEAIT